jgi:hypothetical protein
MVPTIEQNPFNGSSSSLQAPPTIVLHGRSISTKTTFVLLHITTTTTTTTTQGNSKSTTKITPSTKYSNKKQQPSNKPKALCKGIYQNVIVFGEGRIVPPTTTTTSKNL